MANPSRDIKISPFIADADPISTGPKWEKWMDEFETRLRYFRITDDQDRLDALKIYGGRDIREKIKHLRDVTPDDSGEGEEETGANNSAYTAAVEKLNVNIAIKRPITEAHTVEDIAFKLNGAQHFSKLDMNESYHQIELEETSRHLTTFYGVNVDVPENLDYLAKDTKKKGEIKEYADQKRHVKPHKFIVGNPVLVKIKKKCKLTTPYDPQPYVVVRVKGTMITATRLSDGKSITRNASHFKLLEIPIRSVIAISDNLNSRSVDEEDETNLDDIIKNSTLLDYNSRDKNKSDQSQKDSVHSDPNQSVACENENTVSDNNHSDQEQINRNNGNQVDTNTLDVQGTNTNPTRKSLRIKRAPEKFKDYVVDCKTKK
ncbi:hypothetical protein LOTGIDRAFT_174811 [Lottia gigantea]|uniref:Reverse transcriptase domain-containing protein n=1 Tax=Lottia gigantea TaxID=225164 RepID=V4AP62_LOTGI|nr:hypothetical protein LOTGIDRAFT_174811 [Lottia gigantea]ESO96580.1 hypothetical protein LOTGIDRAFT_174811 [Lottia gigantea]